MERFSVCLYGLGGQGLKSMIQDILAPIILEAGLQVQAFPFFGGERRGAPVSGYLRCGWKKITTHSFIINPDMVVIFDHERISATKAMEGLKPGGAALINTAFPKQFMGLTHNWRVCTVDARKISLAHKIGRPEDPYLVINTAMAGAMIKVLETVFKNQFSDKAIFAALGSALSQNISENYEALLDGKRTVSKLIVDASPMWQWSQKSRTIPYLNQPDEHCTKCNLCYLFCPKRAIEISAEARYVIHEERCNYCGICAAICPRGAITMKTEEGAVKNE